MEIVDFDDGNEKLFIRITEGQIDGKHIIDAAVALPDWSANRERFSAPEDVLDPVKYLEYTRIGEFRVGDIPTVIEPGPPIPGNPPAAPWEFWPQHVPLEENYSHSEVQMKRCGSEYKRGSKPNSSTYKKKIRTEFAKIVNVRR